MHVTTPKLRSDGWHRQVLPFVAAYLLYDASRFVVTGHAATAAGIAITSAGFGFAQLAAERRGARQRRAPRTGATPAPATGGGCRG